MPAFRTAKLSLFRDERAMELEEFSENAGLSLSNFFPNSPSVGDILQDTASWQVLSRQAWFQEQNPLVNNGGNLDLTAACMDEGISIPRVWSRITTCDIPNFQRELAVHGLHGIHFRMDVRNDADRIAYTCKLANAVLEKTFPSTGVTDPISILSLLTEEQGSAIHRFLDNLPMSQAGYEKISHDQVVALTSLDYKGRMDEEEQVFFSNAVKDLLSHKTPINEMTNTQLGQAIEQALVPLVYNFGYKLIADGADILTTLREASRRVNVLVSFVPGSPEFCKALSRQILINLLSPFPEGLDMLQAKPEELQGVMLNRVLIEDPLAQAFSSTLAGPVALFSQKSPTRPELKEGLLIKYLARIGFRVDLDIAITGYLAKEREILFLAGGSPGWSAGVDEKLQKDGVDGQVYWNFAAGLFQPSVLSQYSDKAVLNLIALALDREIQEVKKFNENPLSTHVKKTPKGFVSPAAILRDRPHLCEPILELLEKRDWITPNIVEWCGFTGRELRALGQRAPKLLKSIVLESSLGF
jgi:hypothetical protein